MAKSEGLSLDINTLSAKADEIAEIDVKLDAASDSAGAGKRAIANQLVKENEGTIESLVSQITSFLNDADENTVAGVFTGVVRSLNSAFSEPVTKHLEVLASSATSSVEVPSEAEIEELTTVRKKLNEQFKALETLLDSFGIDTSSVAKPKKRTGSRGKRSPRAMSQYQFYLDGTELSAAENNLTLIAKRVGSFDGITVSDDEGNSKTLTPGKALRDFLAENGVDQKNPPAEWSVELPSGNTLSAARFETSDDEDEDEADDEGEE